MKKLLYLMAIAFVFAGCEKAVLKKTSIKIVRSDAAVHTDFPNDASKYLDDYSEQELTDMYVRTLEHEIGRRKISIVDENPDYVLEIHDIHMNEFVTSEYEDGDWIDLSRIDVVGVYTLTQSRVDVPERMEINETVEEEIRNNNKSSKKKDKSTKYHGGVSVDTFGGIQGAMDEHAQSVRKELKSIFKSNQ